MIEIFPPTKEELEEMIHALQKKLEDERYRDEWKSIHQEMERRKRELDNIKNQEKDE